MPLFNPYYSFADVLEMTRCTEAELRAGIAKGLFPAPITVEGRGECWLCATLYLFCASLRKEARQG